MSYTSHLDFVIIIQDEGMGYLRKRSCHPWNEILHCYIICGEKYKHYILTFSSQVCGRCSNSEVSTWKEVKQSELTTPYSFNILSFQIFCEAVGLERAPLSLVRTTEELLGRKSSSSGLEN
jgi:hypothetical protein